MPQKKFLILFISLLLSTSAFSQDGEYVTVRDLETWSSVNLDYNITKHWKIGLEQEFRLADNSSKMDAYITELNTKFDLGKYLYGGFGLRYSRQMDDVGNVQGFENHFRFNIDLGAEHKIKRIKMDYRLRFQTKNEIGITKLEGDYPNNHLRLKVDMEYDIKKWKFDPEFSSEIFRHFEKGETNGFDKFRFTAGTSYKTESFGKLGLFYRIERELNTPFPQTTSIIGFKYSYTINNNKK